MRLFSYCLKCDSGAAPNPYWGLCTLVICKPVIRRAAQVGDWVTGLGSAHSPLGDISNHVIYAMKVTGKMSMAEYDRFCQAHLSGKIPQFWSHEYSRRVGDCLYDYSEGDPPHMRRGVHTEGDRERDLGGEYALISDHFFYFGGKPVELPEHLISIKHCTQGHKSNANQPYVESFVSWIDSQGYKPNTLYGKPQLRFKVMDGPELETECGGCCRVQDDRRVC